MPGIAQERHIAIIGGGIIGSSSLYYLSQLTSPTPLRLTLIEESLNLAPAASGKSGGFLAEDWHGSDTADLAKLSFKLHRELAEKDGGRQKWGYRPVETYSIGFDNDGTKSKKSKCPPELDWIDGKSVSSASNMGGNGTTAQVTPLALVEHLVSESQEKSNVEVLLGTRAERIDVNEAGHVETVIVKGQDGKERKLQVDDVVIATGPWTGKLLKSLLPSTSSQPSFYRDASRITGSRAHSIVVESPKSTTAHCLFTDMHYGRKAGAPEIYAREDGTVYACGGSDELPLPSCADKVIHDSKQTATLVDQVAHLSPSHLAINSGAKIVKEQACYLPIAPRGGPIIAGDKKLGLYVAAGHSCWGILMSQATAYVLREMILDLPLSADISALS